MAALLNHRFQILRDLGQGSQGRVFLAKDQGATSQRDSPHVALKAVPAEARSTLLQEFERLSTVSHPGLARVYGLFESDQDSAKIAKGSLYFSSEYIEGEDLTCELAAGGTSDKVEAILEICEQLAAALSHLHAHDLLHNDIKPDNIRRSKLDGHLVLLDLGLAGPPGTGVPRGSMAYMAPEALAGVRDPRSDLYSLGATLAEFALGERLFPQERSEELMAAILQADSIKIGASLAALPPALVQLIQSLVAGDPSQRPSGAVALLTHVARVRESLGLPIRSTLVSANFVRPEFVGRKEELAELAELLQSHSLGENRESIVVIAGASGSGRRRLVQEALLRHQARCARERRPAQMVQSGLLEELWPTSCDGVRDFLAHTVAQGKGSTVLGLLDVEDPRVAEVLLADIPKSLLVIAARSPQELVANERSVTLSSLSQEESVALCQSLTRATLPEDWIDGALRLSQKLPGRICEIMQVASLLDPEFRDSPETLLVDGTLAKSALRKVDALSAECRALVELLSVASVPVSGAALAESMKESQASVTEAGESLVMAGMVRYQRDGYCLSSQELASLVEESLPGPHRRRLHRMCLSLGGNQQVLYRRAHHMLIVGPAKEACRTALLAIEERSAAGRHDQALSLCVASASQMTGKQASKHAALSAEVALITGDYRLAADFAEKARRSRDVELASRGTLALARCAQHSGDLVQATALLASLVAQDPKDASARANYAKALCAQGEFTKALEHSELALRGGATPAQQFLAHEVAGLANLYLGSVDAVAEHFDCLPALAQVDDDLRLLGRAQGLRGMLAQKQGELALAAELYLDAAKRSAQCGASHAASVFRLNSATVEQRSGRYAAALDSLQAALRRLERSGTPFQLAAAHCNRGNVLLALGEVDAAEREAEVAQNLAESAAEPRIHFYAHLLLGDIAMRRQVSAEADEHYQNACALADEHELSDGILARMALRELQAIHGGDDSSHLGERLVGDSPEQDANALASHLRIVLLRGEVSSELGGEVEALCDKLEAESDLDLGWRVAVLAARTQQALGKAEDFEKALKRAARIFQAVLSQTPEAYREGLRSHPDAQSLEAMTRQRNRDARVHSQDTPNLPTRRLLSLARRLNSELRVDALLDDIIDTAVELSRAERAFLLLRRDDGELELRVARNIDREDLGEKQQLSRSIAEKVARTGQVILTVDAEQDGRFGASLSVATLQLRSILAVPFRVKSRIVGTLYLDHRFRRGAFDEVAVEVVRELAGIAAIALENARLATSNRDRQSEIDELNRQLEERLESTEAELATAKAKIPNTLTGAGFAGLVGESANFRAVLALAERAAACDLPVVIFGESGTGKELLARAIHNQGNRREQAFVALNCGAVPDSLLEAELFGHRKGAFTGAERSRQGLFRVADGGTLFLDEIADTSLAMQSKLLRALQDGEIRPLGSETTVHVNIRILCASNKRLEDLVADGSFREDLYYRLKVLSIDVPALRERRGDIEALALHIMEGFGTKITVTRAALRALQAYSWPGNVRELENELTRAYAIAESESLELSHLSTPLQEPEDSTGMPPSPEEGLLLKPQVEALERSLVVRAMYKTGGNQSKAADLLGLSRYGLQKKLQRYGVTRNDYN